MKFSEDYSESDNVITRYGSGFIEINNQSFENSVLVFPNLPVETWQCDDIEAASQENLRTIIEYHPEIIIIGSGAQFAFPDFELQAWIQTQGIGCEVMDSAAACRTYNVLLSERRKVAAALLRP